MQKKISILVPCFNCEKTIEECLFSIFEQTYGYKNIQLIVINDGSADNTLVLLKKLQKKYNFELYSRENKGISKTRNELLTYVKGEYIFWVDSDDYLKKNMVEEVMKSAIKNDADIVTMKAYRINNKNKKRKYKLNWFFKEGKLKNIKWLNSNIPFLWACVIKTKFWNKHKLKFNEKESFLEDTSLLTIAIGMCKKFYGVDKFLYYWRCTRTSFSDIKTKKYNLCPNCVNQIESFLKEIKKYNIKDKNKVINIFLTNNLSYIWSVCRWFPFLRWYKKPNIEFKNKIVNDIKKILKKYSFTPVSPKGLKMKIIWNVIPFGVKNFFKF